MSVSPLQIATMTSAISNGGYRITPYLVEQLETPYLTIFPNKKDPSKIEWVQKEHLDLVKKYPNHILGFITQKTHREISRIYRFNTKDI